MEQNKTIGIIGAGALGIMYGARMTQALGEDRVFFVADAARAARYRDEGFFCNGTPCALRVVTPAEANRNGLWGCDRSRVHASNRCEAAALSELETSREYARPAEAMRNGLRHCDLSRVQASNRCEAAALSELETPREYAGPVTLAIFAVKGPGLTESIEMMRPFIGPDTVILSLLNGVSSEQTLCEAFGAAHVLYAVAQGTDATRVGTAVTYHSLGQILIGSGTGQTTPDVETAQALLAAGGAPVVVCDDILFRQWNKLMLNVGMNQACAVHDVPYSGVQQPGAPRDTMLAAMREAQALAACEGITLTDADIDVWMQMTDTLNPEGMPSMRQDTLAHRKTEVELFSGTMRRLGKKHGVPTPVNDWLYERILEIEEHYAAVSPHTT